VAGQNNATYQEGLFALVTSPFKSIALWCLLFPILVIGAKLLFAAGQAWYDDDSTFVGIGQQVQVGIDRDIEAATTLSTLTGALRYGDSPPPLCASVLDADSSCRWFAANAGERARVWREGFHEAVFVKTGLWSWPQSSTATPIPANNPFAHLGRQLTVAAKPTIQTISALTEAVVVRLAILVSLIPTALVFLIPAVIDGFVARAVRKARGAGESATLYHRAKQWTVQALSTPIILLSVATVPIITNAVLTVGVVFIAVVAVLIRTWAAFYKKYV
jgi:hypothetical protein